ncbi:MAG TPA: 50S ribosomal protein L6 [Candidatus Moranbacteria bacterium]|nr:50S ribosomal protein L6 [Candidatus Moranbacteria bacterium]
MSRIGKKPIALPQGVTVSVEKGQVSVKGPKGALEFMHHLDVTVSVTDGLVSVEKVGKSKKAPAIWGTTARIIENMVTGVAQGFQRQLELNGVGYRMAISGKKINMALGFSHPVEVTVPEGLEAKIEGNVLTVSGIDKQRVGQFAANIRALKPVEPYKGKGFKYVGEHVRRKEGKKSAK